MHRIGMQTRKKSRVRLKNVTQGPVLGVGGFGTVYSGVYKDTSYAMKVEPIYEKDTHESLAVPQWREIEFAKTMHRLYPDHFMQFYDVCIVHPCTHKQTYKAGHFKNVSKSSYCMQTLWSVVTPGLPSVPYYDLVIQIVYIIYLMQKEGYYHNDLTMQNIGYVTTTKKSLTIFGHVIPTHGYLIQAIDYGKALHAKYELTDKEQHNLATKNDLFWFLSFKENLFTTSLRPYVKKHIEKYLPKTPVGPTYKTYFSEILSICLFGDQTKITYLIPRATILYMIKHIHSPRDVLMYLLKHK